MRSQVYYWSGVTATVYYLSKGEKVSRHQHSFEHTTVPLFGASEVQIFDGRPAIPMTHENNNLTLPANIDHEITASEDGTIIMNMAAVSANGDPQPQPYAPDGGVTLH